MTKSIEDKRIYIYGTKMRGIQIYKSILEWGGNIVSFVDNYSSEKECLGTPVVRIEEVENADIIVLSALKSNVEQEMKDSIISNHIDCEIITHFDFFCKYELVKKMNRGNDYSIDFRRRYSEWINSILSEVDFWNNQVAKIGGPWNYTYESKYIPKEFKCERLRNKQFKSSDIILDVGCGLYSQYGRKYGNTELNIIGVDPLAYFYNRINRRYFVEHSVGYEPSEIRFGLFEALGLFLDNDYADYILIDNALDHCIDPISAIIECLKVLKMGGVLSAEHMCCEAMREGYGGLHQWNICEHNNELIIFSRNSFINVSKLLCESVDIEVNSSLSHSENDPFGKVTFQMIKNKELPESIINKGLSIETIRVIISETMKVLSDTSYALELLKVVTQ